MNTVELFCGTKSFSKVMEEYGFLCETLDNNIQFDPGILGDIRDVKNNSFPYTEFLWASPPCQGFSVAVIGRNWNHDGTPKTDSARLAMELAKKTIAIIKASKPKYWFIENPRGMLRKMPFMEKFLKEMGGGTAHYRVLSVRRHAPEAHRHMDERAFLETATYVFARLVMSRCSAAGFTHWNARTEGSERTRRNSRCSVRGNIKTVWK